MSSCRPRAAGGEAGFTLAELLVALALLALVSVLVANGLSFGARAWERGYGGAEALDETRALQHFLRRMIAAAHPYVIDSTLQTRYVDFTGESSRIRFVGPALPQMALRGLTRYELSLSSLGRDSEMVLRWCPIDRCRDQADFFNRSERTVVARGVERVRFRYGAAGQASRDWSLTWTNQEQLPAHVEVALSFPRGDRRVWPLLVAAPRIDQDARCIFDPISRQCRSQ